MVAQQGGQISTPPLIRHVRLALRPQTGHFNADKDDLDISAFRFLRITYNQALG
jgi:hypothetical protein